MLSKIGIMPETLNYLKLLSDVPRRAHLVHGTSKALLKAYAFDR